MKKSIITLFALSTIVATTSCEKTIISDGSFIEDEVTTVTMSFSPYDVTSMRAAASIANYCNHLDVWIIDGEDTIAIHQTTEEAGFGDVSLSLNRTKTYTLYAVGHKADGATLSDGVISFTDDKVTHAMYYSTTFSPATTTNLSCLMTRIVADFRLEITDDIPAECKSLRFTISSVFDRWNVTTGGTHQLDRVSTITYGGTSSIFNVYAIVTDAQTLHTVTVEAFDADGNALVPTQQKVFENVPLRNGYKTTYRGAFFTTESVTSSFTVDDWSSMDVIDF